VKLKAKGEVLDYEVKIVVSYYGLRQPCHSEKKRKEVIHRVPSQSIALTKVIPRHFVKKRKGKKKERERKELYSANMVKYK